MLGLSLEPIVAVVLVLGFLLSHGLYALYHHFATRHGLVQVATWRSAHVGSVPTGAGIVITLVALPLLALLVSPASALFLTIASFGTLLAVLGFVDDHRPLPVSLRLFVQIFSAVGTIVCLAISDVPLTADGVYHLAGVGLLVPLLGMVWVMNVHNFMDGLDGFASLQSLCFLMPAALLFLHDGHVDVMLVALIVAAPVLAFLFWNLPLGRLFLGDAGAIFLGFVIALLMLVGWQISWYLFIALVMLYALFLVDATCTIVWRWQRGENCFAAHRSHLFQQLARRHGTTWVLKGLLLINLGWLLPLAALVTAGLISPLAGLLFVYAPLIAGYVRWHQADAAILG